MSEAELLVVRQLEALRTAGKSQLEGVQLVADALPDGALKARCVEAVRQLASGAVQPAASAFDRLLRSANATPKSLSCLAQSLEAQLEASEVTRSAVLFLRFVVLGPFLALALRDLSHVESMFRETMSTLPVLTEAVLFVSDVGHYVGPPLALVLVVALGRFKPKWVPGARQLEVSARAFESAALGAPVSLDPSAQALFEQLSRFSPREQALERVGEEYRAEARRAAVVSRVLAPMVGLVVNLLIVGTVLIALYLPIFSIAGAIK